MRGFVASFAFAPRWNGPECVEEVGRTRRWRIVGNNRILSVFGVKRVHSIYDLREVVFRLGFLGLVLHAAEGGKQQAHQDHDDGDDDEKFDEGEAVRFEIQSL